MGEWLTYLANCNSVKSLGLRLIHPQRRPIEDFWGWIKVFKNNHLSQILLSFAGDVLPNLIEEEPY